jgi:hypothetical protein
VRIAVSVDMEGASQLRSVREIWGCLPEYWQTGKPRLEDDVAGACEGLLATGTSNVVVLDNHGGNTVNVSAEALPAGARLETWRDFDLLERCLRDAASAPTLPEPSDVTFEASMPNGSDVANQMLESGWTRSGEVEFSAQLRMWRDARELLAAAMNAALVPFLPYGSAPSIAPKTQPRPTSSAWESCNSSSTRGRPNHTRSGIQRRRIPCRRASLNSLHRHRRLR